LQDGEDAYLFRSGDARALAQAVRKALADPTMAVRRGLSAKERVSSYSEEEMFRDTFEMLESLYWK
jgi:glycosyltransferase involved in cell wall biosynthesis